MDVSLEAAPAVLYDALVLPDGDDAIQRAARRWTDARIHQGPVPPLQADPRAGRGRAAASACGIETALPDGQTDPGLIIDIGHEQASDAFVAAIAKHRHFARETDPPRV